MPPANENFTNFNLASNYDITSPFIPSNLDHTPDFDTMPVPTTADSGLWSYNTEPVTGNQHASAPDMLEQFLNNFPANTNGI